MFLKYERTSDEEATKSVPIHQQSHSGIKPRNIPSSTNDTKRAFAELG